jgi:hypothetical protein
VALRHPAWRQFEAWSIQADDATEAALLGLGLGRAHLSALPPILRRSALPDLVDVHDAIRLNLPGDEVIGKLKEAERFVAAMAIPFAVAVLNDLLAVALEMFQSAGAAVAIGDPFELVLQRLRDALTAHCAVAVRRSHDPEADRPLERVERRSAGEVGSGSQTPGHVDSRPDDAFRGGRSPRDLVRYPWVCPGGQRRDDYCVATIGVGTHCSRGLQARTSDETQRPDKSRRPRRALRPELVRRTRSHRGHDCLRPGGIALGFQRVRLRGDA